MKIEPDKNKVSSFTNKYWREGRRVLYKNSRRVVELIGNVPIDEIKGRAKNMLDSVELRQYLTEMWVGTAVYFAGDMSSRLIQRQTKESNMWDDAYRNYIAQRVLEKSANIARTQATLINSTIDLVLQEGFAEGYSIDRLTERIVKELDKRLKAVHSWEAERIARTEVIGASNKGSFDGALSTGLDIKKGWLTSGLKGVRGSHAMYEGMGFVPMNYDYNVGLKHPGDPNGSPEEIINCRCTIIYEV